VSNGVSEINAIYFYKSSLKDINLEGTRKKESFDFAFTDINNDDKILEKFELTRYGNDSFKGTWTNKEGKKLPVVLNPIDFSKYPTEKMQELDNKIDAVKLNLMEFKQDSVSTFKGKEFIWYSEKHCSSPLFRLGNNFSDKCKSIVNPILTKIHIRNTLSQLDCSSRFEYSQGSGIEYSIDINFLNSNLLGFHITSSWFCGGAHPDFGGEGYLMDLNNGKRYGLDEIIVFDKSATTEEKNGFDKFSEYRSNFLAPKLLALINETEHFERPSEEDEDNCDYTDLDVWDFPSWNFTEKGIEFTPYFPRVNRSCENSFLVTFEKLAKYKNKEFPYPLY
jgi:hypothetical protein